jgi:hypothetical protein
MMLRYIARDVYWAIRGSLAAAVKGGERLSDPRRGIVRGLPGGLSDGWRTFAGERRR